MRLGHYTFFCRLKQNAHLPQYKGSTFRGAFGYALKQTVCALRQQDCNSCLLRQTCLYVKIFEENLSAPLTQRLAATPHPYVILPPDTEEQFLPEGSAFDFSLLLFGDVNDALPYFVYAFEKMGQLGIGKGKAKFTLEQVSCKGIPVYQKGETLLSRDHGETELKIPDEFEQDRRDLRLSLKTPLRVKNKSRFVRQLDFTTLTRSALRRVSGIFAAYGDGDPDLPYRELIQQAEGVNVVSDQTHWHEWQRYSNRQKESMQFGGLRGEIVYSQVPAAHRQLLELASQVHLGKQTSFGLGQIEVEAL